MHERFPLGLGCKEGSSSLTTQATRSPFSVTSFLRIYGVGFLTLLNNAFVIAQSEHLAKRLQEEAPTLDGQVERAYQLLYNRKPSANELTLARQFMTTQSLDIYCRVLINSNEFIYVP